MDLAWISLIALGIVIVFSCTTKVHPGVLAMVLAWLVGTVVGPYYGQPIPFRQVLAGFPTSLFVTLTGVSLFFTQAQLNGTLDKVARAAVRLCRGNVGLIGVMFFFLTTAFATVGAGNIAAAALIAPLAMNVAHRANMPPLLMAIMVGHGAIAGALSPISPTGIIARDRMADIQLTGYEIPIFLHNMVANLAVAAAGYLLLGGWKLFSQWYSEPAEDSAAEARPRESMETGHWCTLGLIGCLLVGVVFFGVDVGMGACAGAVLLTLFRLGDDREAIRKMPWSVILMVCGVTVLTSLLEKTGGTTRFEEIIRWMSTPETVPGVVAFIAGVVSVYSSTSGVVLPAFLPIARGVGGDPLAVASAIIVGGHLVDSSPLSTIGALCIASAPASEDRGSLFNKMLAWGLSMSVVGAVLCYVAFGLLWS